jgi:hypothetical protein
MNKTIIGLIAGVILLGSVACGSNGDETSADAGRSVDTQPVSKDTGAADAAGVGVVDSAGAREVGRDTTTVPSPDAAKDALFDTSAATIPDTGRDQAGPDTTRDLAMDGPAFEAASDSPLDRGAADGALDVRREDGLSLGDAESPGDQPKVRLSKVSVYGNCMPIVANDPIIAFWTVDISGAQGSSARLTQAALAVTGSTTVNQVFTVETPAVSLVNGAGSADHRKRKDSTTTYSVCNSLCGDAHYQLDLVFSVDGQDIPVSSSGVFGCAM